MPLIRGRVTSCSRWTPPAVLSPYQPSFCLSCLSRGGERGEYHISCAGKACSESSSGKSRSGGAPLTSRGRFWPDAVRRRARLKHLTCVVHNLYHQLQMTYTVDVQAIIQTHLSPACTYRRDEGKPGRQRQISRPQQKRCSKNNRLVRYLVEGDRLGDRSSLTETDKLFHGCCSVLKLRLATPHDAYLRCSGRQ